MQSTIRALFVNQGFPIVGSEKGADCLLPNVGARAAVAQAVSRSEFISDPSGRVASGLFQGPYKNDQAFGQSVDQTASWSAVKVLSRFGPVDLYFKPSRLHTNQQHVQPGRRYYIMPRQPWKASQLSTVLCTFVHVQST